MNPQCMEEIVRKRVVVTGLGVVSCLGNSKADVLRSLQEGRSGITFNESFRDMGLRSQICGSVDIAIDDIVHLEVAGTKTDIPDIDKPYVLYVILFGVVSIVAAYLSIF